MKLLEDVVEEHAEEAAFLWHQRDMAVRAPDFDLDDVMEWDERVDAHLDGLLIAGETGWEQTSGLGFEDPGEFFTGLWLAIALGKKNCVDELLLASEDNSEAHRAMISALGWLEPDKLQGVVKALLSSRQTPPTVLRHRSLCRTPRKSGKSPRRGFGGGIPNTASPRP